MASSPKKKSSKKKKSQLSSKTKKIKKNHRSAPKKIGRRLDSGSEDSMKLQPVSLPSNDSNSDNDSTSSLSMSSSSSEGTYRSRKKGSRLKKRDKGRASRRPSSNEDLTHGKKRKRSKKKKGHHEHESRKKSQKKKARKHASISSVDDDSSSSATCKSSSTIEESDTQRRRTKLKEKKKPRVESKLETVLNEERSDKSPKGSSINRSNNDQSYRVSHDWENFVGENKSRRLKSVITVVVKPHEEEEYTLEKDKLEEKTEGNLGDIPPSYSTDTSGKRSKRDPQPRLPPAEDFSDGGSSLITQRVSEQPLEYRKTELTHNIEYPLREELMNESEKDCSGRIQPDDSPGGNDLETVLRRKALENLKKFRGKVETDVKTIGNESKDIGKNVGVGKKSIELGSLNVNEIRKDDVIPNPLSIAKEKFVWRRLPRQEVNYNVTGNAILNESMKPPFKRDSGQQFSEKSSEAVKVSAVKEHGSSESGSFLQKVKHSGMQETTSVSSGKQVIVNKVTEAHTIAETTTPISIDDHQRKVKDVSAPNSATNDKKNEAKEGSDFKEKKMSVMRGGEMVEVSYKVYIPQRAPALARRHLKR